MVSGIMSFFSILRRTASQLLEVGSTRRKPEVTQSMEGVTMKQARWWLLMAAALLVPAGALAQPKGGGGKNPKPGTPAAAAGGDIELDEKPAETPDAGAAGSTDTPPPGDNPTGGGICDVDPTAPGCGKGGDVPKASATREVNADIVAVQQIYALKYHRFEVNPYFALSLNDQFVSHVGPGIAANWYISDVLAVGANFNYYGGLNVDSEFNFQNRRATRVAVPLNEYLLGANANMTYVPVYGKFASIGDFIFHYDAYVVGGVGALWTRPIPVIDPDNRKFSYEARIAFNAGIGLRVFFNRWFAATAEIRDYIYPERIESTVVPTNQADQTNPAKWTGDSQLTNNVQAQLGVSIFLPFSWEYRLPK
jgi:outer membrane beta-barrel protein